jgi:hypothetical protein
MTFSLRLTVIVKAILPGSRRLSSESGFSPQPRERGPEGDRSAFVSSTLARQWPCHPFDTVYQGVYYQEPLDWMTAARRQEARAPAAIHL